MKMLRVLVIVLFLCCICTSCSTDTEFQLGIQLGQGACKGINFYVKDGSIRAILCDINAVNFQITTIYERSEPRQLSEEEMETIKEHLQKVKELEGTEFYDPRIKDRAFMTLYYDDRCYYSDYHAWELSGYPYDDGYEVLNEFADYLVMLMPEFCTKVNG